MTFCAAMLIDHMTDFSFRGHPELINKSQRRHSFLVWGRHFPPQISSTATIVNMALSNFFQRATVSTKHFLF